MNILDDLWFTVKQIAQNTYAISEYGHWEKVHSFLLVGDTTALLIDTGLGIDNLKRITDQLTTLPITVVTTHVHWDHIGSHSHYEEIYVHALEADWLINGIKGLPITQIRHDIARDITYLHLKHFNLKHSSLFKEHQQNYYKMETLLISEIGRFKLYIPQVTHRDIFAYTIMKLRFYLREIYFMRARFLHFIHLQIL